jgi:ABC-type dipeptide/oligopeptide/nickel transport system permease subunit
VPRHDPWVYIGLVAFFALLFIALFGARVAPHESIYFVVEHGRDPRPYDPGVVFPLGSDVLGRDLLSLVLAGAGTTLLIVVLAGLARVLAGVAIAAIAGWWRPARALGNASAELVAAVPATIVAVLVVKVFVRGDASFLVFVGALLLTGWAGPYRLLRTELDRLSRLGFTESASALGAGRLRVFVTHHLPHLVPLLAMNAAQQTVASLVAMAELGVLGVFVGATRLISIEESLSIVRVGQSNNAPISEPPEWGGLLATAATLESLWTTRFLFLVPGVAFVLAAVAIAAIGLGLARHYARRNLLQDLRGRGARVLALACAILVIAALLTPERYADARVWAHDARSSVEPTSDIAAAFEAAGLRPVGASFELTRSVERIAQTGPAQLTIGDVSLRESSDGPVEIRSLVYAESGGGRVDAPLAFASWGISPADYPPGPRRLFNIDFGETIKSFPDDYAQVDVRGKVAIVMRYTGIETGRGNVPAPDVASQVNSALKRGAVGVIVIDSRLSAFPRVSLGVQQNPYQRLEQELPVQQVSGAPVVILSTSAADKLLRPHGVVPSEIYAKLMSVQTFTPGTSGFPVVSPWIASDSEFSVHSIARDLTARAQVDLPLARVRADVRTILAETDAPTTAPRVVVWAVNHDSSAGRESIDAMLAAARGLRSRAVPFVFVAFDPSVDPTGNARMVADALTGRKLGLFIVLDDLVGDALTFRTPFGDLVPAFDRYAENAGARYVTTRSAVRRDSEAWTWPGIAPFIDNRSIVVSGNGRPGDVRADAAALIGHVAGRLALGAEELSR